jgi:predicted DNA-binding transcriptional regulator AlpA
MRTPNILEELLTEQDIARMTGMSLASVRRWRLLKRGPRFIKLGAAVRYRFADVQSWLESRPTGGEEAGARVRS